MKRMREIIFPNDYKFYHFVHESVDALESAKIDYCIIGGVALHAQGYSRMTIDLDVLVGQSIESCKYSLSQAGFKHVFGRRFKNPKLGDFELELIAKDEQLNPGDYSYPDPKLVREDYNYKGKNVWVLSLYALIETKLSGYVFNRLRLKDAGDIQELIKTNLDFFKGTNYKFSNKKVQKAWNEILDMTILEV